MQLNDKQEVVFHSVGEKDIIMQISGTRNRTTSLVRCTLPK
jgi:uncharacterized protein (DUF111 family)